MAPPLPPPPEVTTDDSLSFMQTVWYVVAEKILKRIVEVTGLDGSREKALRAVALRPNDFNIYVKGTKIEEDAPV
jgi:hypothetical protein